MYYKLTIDETSRNNPKANSQLFNKEVKKFKTVEEVREYLIDRYGKMPLMRNKVYQDKKDGTTEAIGFLKSYWHKDISHNSKSWYQTDWVTVTEVTEKPVLLNR